MKSGRYEEKREILMADGREKREKKENEKGRVKKEGEKRGGRWRKSEGKRCGIEEVRMRKDGIKKVRGDKESL